MTLVTDLYEQVTAAFSAELSQSNGVTDKNDIGVEKLIVSAERTQDLVTESMSVGTALLKRFRRPHPLQPLRGAGASP